MTTKQTKPKAWLGHAYLSYKHKLRMVTIVGPFERNCTVVPDGADRLLTLRKALS